ncbi:MULTISPECIES: hypothetical protein [Candidatus Nitrosocaldus]|jgi:predicted nucleic acid-binding protein|uniref:PIN domain-containing protein n=1 Tax=Candidatus Nitrosocaldus cavascurensis TaxID=2058097 RepID=A0A2K5ARG4_9ARCH|nr:MULTISPECIES: hypothetical protein [Candidatus Nitrosocaldus]SPC34189.1 protein of unknown function [Candidatus Nitrosocaldus cavascurensis]
MDLVVDEFIISVFLSADDKMAANKMMDTFTLLDIIIRKCHKLIFHPQYLNHLRKKLEILQDKYKRNQLGVLIINPLHILLFHETKVNRREGGNIPELKEIKDEADRLVVKSALAIATNPKYIITTDSDLLNKKDMFKRYGIEVITPNEALSILS